jgi:hypothetical protein
MKEITRGSVLTEDKVEHGLFTARRGHGGKPSSGEEFPRTQPGTPRLLSPTVSMQSVCASGGHDGGQTPLVVVIYGDGELSRVARGGTRTCVEWRQRRKGRMSWRVCGGVAVFEGVEFGTTATESRSSRHDKACAGVSDAWRRRRREWLRDCHVGPTHR